MSGNLLVAGRHGGRCARIRKQFDCRRAAWLKGHAVLPFLCRTTARWPPGRRQWPQCAQAGLLPCKGLRRFPPCPGLLCPFFLFRLTVGGELQGPFMADGAADVVLMDAPETGCCCDDTALGVKFEISLPNDLLITQRNQIYSA